VADARAAFARAATINPDIPWSYPEQARVELVAARWAARMGTDRSPYLANAEAAVERALELNRRSSLAWRMAAELELERARWARVRKRPGLIHVGRGLDAADSALELNPGSAATLLTRAALLVERVRLQSPSSTRRRAAASAQSLVDRALELNGHLSRECSTLGAELSALVEAPGAAD